jgi:hypothetical protein
MIEEKAFESLKTNVQHFAKLVGEPRKEGEGFAFPTGDLPFQSLHIRYEIEKKFLGKIYVMVVEAGWPQGEILPPSERMELRYSGFFRKGKPFFLSVPSKKADDSGSRALKIVNEDRSLLDECWKLEVEFLRVFFDFGEKAWKVQVRPYGGSFIKIVLPPLQYRVPLGQEQTVLILSVMKRIVERIDEKGVGIL